MTSDRRGSAGFTVNQGGPDAGVIVCVVHGCVCVCVDAGVRRPDAGLIVSCCSRVCVCVWMLESGCRFNSLCVVHGCVCVCVCVDAGVRMQV